MTKKNKTYISAHKSEGISANCTVSFVIWVDSCSQSVHAIIHEKEQVINEYL